MYKTVQDISTTQCKSFVSGVKFLFAKLSKVTRNHKCEQDLPINIYDPVGIEKEESFFIRRQT